MRSIRLPELTFPKVSYGQLEVPWDLRPLLYRDGAGANAKAVSELLTRGELGAPIPRRITLVKKLHAEIEVIDNRGSAFDAITKLRKFYAWADEVGRSPTVATVEQDFIDWTDHLVQLVRVKQDLTAASAYAYGSKVSVLISGALDLPQGLMGKTRLSMRRSKRVLSTKADKQSLDGTFAFGHFLLDLTKAFSVDAINAPPPITIAFRSGQTIEHWYGIREPARVRSLASDEHSNVVKQQRRIRHRANWAANTSHRTRYSVINLRVEAEMLIFIAQTGMNLAQLKGLRMGQFRYQSHLDGYRIYRMYKGRRSGEVEFEIFSEYRVLFEGYLAWRRTMFPGDDGGLLFPRALQPGKSRPAHAKLYWDGVHKMCAALGIKFIGPQTLRKTRVNWLLRRSRDPKLTAEMAQHSQETLIRTYQQPHHHAAVLEISRFHAGADPAFAMPGPGVCIKSSPIAQKNSPLEAPRPDCVSAAGCLFCGHQRDVDSHDHVWSLATYRHLKSLELSRYRPSAGGVISHPALASVDRITEKLKHFESSSQVRALWVGEALARVNEGDYHPKWDGFITLLEVQKCL